MTKRILAACLLATTVLATPTLAQGTGQFVTEQGQTQWRVSRLMGVDVYGSDNAKIGDIKDVLLDRTGNAETAIIGVGGFLGIGEKNVGVPFKSLEWSTEPMRATATASGDVSSTGTAGTSAPSGSAAAPTVATAPRGDAASRGYPDHALLRMSKADLTNAPDFKYAGAAAAAPAASNAAPPAGGLMSPMGGGAATNPPRP